MGINYQHKTVILLLRPIFHPSDSVLEVCFPVCKNKVIITLFNTNECENLPSYHFYNDFDFLCHAYVNDFHCSRVIYR